MPIARPSTGWYTRTTSLQAGWLESSITGQLRSGAKKYARFGWLDFIDDPEVVKCLLGLVEEWAREQGMEGIQGPMGFCDLDKEGMLIEGFDQPGTFTTIYNYPYYPKYMEMLGYVKDVDWYEYCFGGAR